MSTALRINEDILHELMLYMGPVQYATAALVARRWTPPAQKALYRSITFRVYGESELESPGPQLVETLKRHSHLRALVRQISIHASTSQELDWMDMFPEESLRNFTYICWPRNAFSPALLQKDAIRTVPHLTAHGPMDAAGLQACFELPLMETLELDLSDWDLRIASSRPPMRMVLPTLDVTVDASRARNLEHLYVHIQCICQPIVIAILAALAHQLRSLHIHVSPGAKLDSRGSWAKEFIGHVRRGANLTRVVFSGFPESHAAFSARNIAQQTHPYSQAALSARWQQWERTQQVQPFLNVIAQQSALEHLGCIDGLYTEELFRTLPHTMRALDFYVDEETFGCEGALLDLLGRVEKDGLFLRRVTFFAAEERRTLFGAIEAACKENGVDFVFFPVVTPLNNPPTRPPIAWD
ncbi:hypothetical protein K466DRAFT_663385 [Polyporus arcularius HHB13444]|uniref:F-box domain-containing protein n=1 Tax=Polyporus arcularius HHB13444 TaxID=1314778 RepID=A0A5C3PB39_9APHY|nr:hypothetical protein K466DRAFT_663385 [Polyporus arcularius HHB13444]